jgi:hypothetical protein
MGCLIWGIIFLAGAIFLLKWYFKLQNYAIGLICSIALFIMFFIAFIMWIRCLIERRIKLREKFIYDNAKMEGAIYTIAALKEKIRDPKEILKLMEGEKIVKY